MVKAILMLMFGVSGQASVEAVAGIFSVLSAKLEKAIEKCRSEIKFNDNLILDLRRQNAELYESAQKAGRIQAALKNLS